MEGIWTTLILIDLDRFEEKTVREGLNPYKPNVYTGTLSHLVELFARRWNAHIVYGLDWERGTEEAVIQIPAVEPWEVAGDLRAIAEEMCRLGAPVTIVALSSPLHMAKARRRREAYQGPVREAKRVLEKIKRAGGGKVWVDGETIYECTPG